MSDTQTTQHGDDIMKNEILEAVRTATITTGYNVRTVQPAVDAALAEGLIDGDVFRHGPVSVEIRDGVAHGTYQGQTKAIPINDATRPGLLKSKAIMAGLRANR